MESREMSLPGNPNPPRGLFSRMGVELEYMIVDQASLDVRPIADRVLIDAAGAVTGELERGPVTWSNELVAHVVELKVTEPARRLEGLAGLFDQSVRDINALLAPHGARLLPSGMHPWMDPYRETKLWEHDYNEVYAAFDRVFGCQGHGWSNLQSVHLNLPFDNDDEFGRLHAAIRLLLPILPALAASSPAMGGQVTGFLDNRLEVYRTNSRKVPEVAGRVIPEAVFTRDDYERLVLDRLYRAIAPHDPEGILQEEWLNARGAIARFMRNTIEIRVLDVQECPQADLAICAAIVGVLRLLVGESLSPLSSQKGAAIEPLESILLATIRDADLAPIADRDYLRLLGFPGETVTAGELWRRLVEQALAHETLDRAFKPTLDVMIHQGPLARRITRALAASGEASSSDALRAVYNQLASCLERGELFQPPGPV